MDASGALIPAPESTRPCNTKPCITYAYVTSDWTSCSGPCGTRTRAVACVAFSTSATNSLSVDAAHCASIGPPPPASEPCPDTCTFCDQHQCSNGGVCDSVAGACVCPGGVTGLLCQASLACASVVSADGVCCPSGAVLTLNDACCVGSLDGHGACCPLPSTVNACGECGGSPSALLSSTSGDCCDNGVTDASGACCPSGAVDDFGVCDGNNASGAQAVTLAVGLGGAAASATQADLDDPSSPVRTALDATLVDLLAGSLDRPPSSISITSVTLTVRRRALAPHGRGLTSGAQVDFTLLPYGGENNLPAGQLEDLITAAGPSAGVTVQGVTGTAPVTVCGNGACEVGERPDLRAGTGCSEDCPFPIAVCGAVAGKVCNGAGACTASSSGGQCACFSQQGYAGALCSQCASGFVGQAVNGSVACTRLQASSSRTTPLPPSPSSTNLLPVVAGVVGGGVAVLALVAFALWRSKSRATRTVRVVAVAGSKVVSPVPGTSAVRPDGSPSPGPVSREGFLAGDATLRVSANPYSGASRPQGQGQGHGQGQGSASPRGPPPPAHGGANADTRRSLRSLAYAPSSGGGGGGASAGYARGGPVTPPLSARRGTARSEDSVGV